MNTHLQRYVGSTILIGIVAVLFAFKFTEYHRFREWWGITDDALIESKGILGKTIRKVSFPAISDIDISQTPHKRLLGYGNVNVRLYTAKTNFSVKNINYPDDFADILQKKISKSFEDEK